MKDQKSTPCCGETCCVPEAVAMPLQVVQSADDVRDSVRAGYAQIARTGSWAASKQKPGASGASCCGGESSAAGGGCCGPATFSPDQLARALGYSGGELDAAPESANMGLSCGNPTALASLRAGETVLDLGAGGGFDCFIAGSKVGAAGRVIGVDMTPDMLAKARANIAHYTDRTGLRNVEFRLGEIEHLPVADASVDVVISNCVLNLSPDKPRVWKEIARVLKPGGRVAVSDIGLLRHLPDTVRNDLESLVGCVAGAVPLEETRQQALDAGLCEVELTSERRYIDALSSWDDPLMGRIQAALPRGTKPSDYITSFSCSAKRR